MKRRAYLAGRWYPAGARACSEAIEQHARDTAVESGAWRALVAPHAGWTYSGDVAAQTYRWLAHNQPNVDRVVLFGSHRSARGPNTIFRADAWETPVGDFATDHDAVAAITNALPELLDDEPVTPSHPDNAAELHLPLARHFFPQAKLVMLGVAAAPVAIVLGEAVGRVCAAQGGSTVVLGSTDLTHYGAGYGFAPQGLSARAVEWVRTVNDAGFIEAMLARDEAAVLAHAEANSSACCPGAVAATLAAARVLYAEDTAASLAKPIEAVEPHLVAHRLSYDVAPNDDFVGYAGVLL